MSYGSYADENKDFADMTEQLIDAIHSEKCGHSVMDTIIDSATFEDPLLEKAYRDYLSVRKDLGRETPITLDDIAGIAVRHLRREGKLDKLDESHEGSASTVMINVKVDGENEPWLLSFGNDAGDICGCVSDAVAGRAYAYSAVRLTCEEDAFASDVRSADEFADFTAETGVSTGIVDELYYPGNVSRRMEVCAVAAAAPSVDVRREKPESGDLIMILGGSNACAGPEGQKGSASEERKLQRFFRNGVAARMVKRSSAVRAGGVSAAIGKIADGAEVNLDAITQDYDESNAAEIAVREISDAIICVIAPENERLLSLIASEENLRCDRLAVVSDAHRVVLHSKGQRIAEIPLEILRSAGEDKHIDIITSIPGDWRSTSMFREARSFTAAMNNMAQDINICSKRGLAERFDATVGGGALLMPFGGHSQITPAQAAVNKIPVKSGDTDDCTVMAWGFNPLISNVSPYHGAYLGVVESIAKVVATGASLKDVYLTCRASIDDPGDNGTKWGAPFASMLGAFEAQMGLGIGAIGRESTVRDPDADGEGYSDYVAIAVAMSRADRITSPEFKKAGHKVIILRPAVEHGDKGVGNGLPHPAALLDVWQKASELIASGDAVAACTPGIGGVAEAIMKMSFGNGIGFKYNLAEDEAKRIGSRYKRAALEELFGYSYGSIILELNKGVDVRSRLIDVLTLGFTTKEQEIAFLDEKLDIVDLLTLYEGRLEGQYPNNADNRCGGVGNVNYKARSWNTPIFKRAEPRVLIPVFPGTSGEYESAKAVRDAGAIPDLFMVRDRTADELLRSTERFAAAVKETQMVFIPGGSLPNGESNCSAQFITDFFRNEAVKESISNFIKKQEGLMCGISDGFQALVKLGLVPYGKILEPEEIDPELTFNTIERRQSRIVRVRIASNKSPWLRYSDIGEISSLPISHVEGRFVASDEFLRHLAGAGQVATQYVDLEGNASADIRFNPNGSMLAVEGLTSPDGRVIGRMGHAERTGAGLYKNVPGNYISSMFENAVKYFK